MSYGMYEVVALIPSSSTFSVAAAVAWYASLTEGKVQLRSEPANAKSDEPLEGFRVWYGDWAIVAWLDESSGVADDSADLANETPLPADARVIAGCTKRLDVISDEDPHREHSDEITHFTDELREHFGLFLFDPVNGGWWS
jgi:hypothetical protein